VPCHPCTGLQTPRSASRPPRLGGEDGKLKTVIDRCTRWLVDYTGGHGSWWIYALSSSWCSRSLSSEESVDSDPRTISVSKVYVSPPRRHAASRLLVDRIDLIKEVIVVDWFRDEMRCRGLLAQQKIHVHPSIRSSLSLICLPSLMRDTSCCWAASSSFAYLQPENTCILLHAGLM
jgi:hypothetical protein